ncbi:MAG: hypothetical protein ACK5PC_14530 [Cyclobacteriaceae bacterium]|jgi:hypothetical protein|nr:hypothetical protein [Flammeovirgaceae bacterium]
MQPKTFLAALALCLISTVAFSQEFEVPANFQPKNDSDYTQYESDVLKCIQWLMQTPPDAETEKQKDANAFLLKWMTGTSTVHIEVKQEIVTFMDTPELLMIFMGGWTKYTLETKDADNKVNCSLAGVEAVIEYYTKNKAVLSKSKGVEKYIKMKEKGTLKEYIQKNA